MELFFQDSAAVAYTSLSQKARVLSEKWVDESVFCPNCGKSRIDKFPNNQPVADFQCLNCKEQFELKSKKDNLGIKIVDGAYKTMIERLESNNNPNFFLLNYNLHNYSVKNFVVIPKHFFVPEIIEKRKPLTPSAKRAGWIGCNILLRSIPETGKIFYIRNGQVESKECVLSNWRKTSFLRDEKEMPAKSWLLHIMRSIEKIGKQDFFLDDVYAFEKELSKLHPENNHVKDKIRQQLQILRDKGYLTFSARGRYSLTEF
jgi:type II restriction enzyme